MDLKLFAGRLIDKIYKVNDVQQGYFYWRFKLLDITMRIFQYNNLPESIPQEEIEKRLMQTGHCSFIQHPKFGLVVCNSWLYGYDVYGRFRYANFFNPFQGFIQNGFLGMAKEIDKDCAVIYNTVNEKYLYQPLQGMDNFMQTVNRYARNLADIESSINLAIINSREPYLLTAGNQQIKDSIIDVFRSIKRGEQKVVVDDDILKNVQSLKAHDIVTGFLKELMEQRDFLIKQFLAEIGIYTQAQKKERLIVGEIDQEQRNMKLFIYSMLKEREEGLERVNNLYGTNITVELNTELYDMTKLYDDSADWDIKEEEAELENAGNNRIENQSSSADDSKDVSE